MRDLLGVSTSDNLVSAKRVLVVEGVCDELIVKRLLAWKDSRIGTWLKEGTIAVRPLGGTHSLVYELSRLQNELCDCMVLYDYDKEGKVAVERACEKGLLNDVANQAIPTSRDADHESELEDFINPSLYVDYLADRFKICFDSSSNAGRANRGRLASRTKKWSDRIGEVFATNGATLSQDALVEIKKEISERVSSYTGDLTDIVSEDALFLERLADLLADGLL